MNYYIPLRFQNEGVMPNEALIAVSWLNQLRLTIYFENYDRYAIFYKSKRSGIQQNKRLQVEKR